MAKIKKKVLKKLLFSLMARPLPPPLLVARPLVDELFFFAASLREDNLK